MTECYFETDLMILYGYERSGAMNYTKNNTQTLNAIFSKLHFTDLANLGRLYLLHRLSYSLEIFTPGG